MDFRPSRTAATRLAGYPEIHWGPRPRPVPEPPAPVDNRTEAQKIADMKALWDELTAE